MLYKKNSTSFHFPFFIVTAMISLSTISCSKTPDVRLTMCQDLMVLFLNSPENREWQEHEPIIRGYKDLEIQVSYSSATADGQIVDQASCFYTYTPDQDATGAEEFNTPTAAYSTYPNKMVINGKVVNKNELANGVNMVMLNQGKKAIIKAKEKVKAGVEKINQEVEKHLEK